MTVSLWDRQDDEAKRLRCEGKEAHAGTLANLLPELRSRDLDERPRVVGVG